jgi:membrane protein YdbS with pleckstrin-like domain
MKIAESATRSQFPLSTKKVLKKTITGTLAWLFIFGILIALFLVGSFNVEGRDAGIFNLMIIGIIILFIIILLTTYLYQKWYYAVYFYDLTNNYIIIRKGPITPAEITVPFERIQDVYVDQDLLDRIFGLYDVHISSATFSSGIAAHIDGVEKMHADGLKAMILEKVHSKISLNK